MRVVVTGASGNVGTQVVRHLLGADGHMEVVGLCRRPPAESLPQLRWVAVDLAEPASAAVLRRTIAGADAVVHLAWLLQPSWNLEALRRVNVEGSRRVFEAAADAGVSALVYASSVGAYSPGPVDRRVDESWPTEGIPTSSYARHKAAVERMLDDFERANPTIRVVRLRPALIFQRAAASEIARFFLGPLVPRSLVRRALIPIVPAIPGVKLQAVHADDVGAAYQLAVTKPDARGAYNIAAEPVLDPPTLGRLLHARPVPVPVAPVRALMAFAWWLRLQPSEPGWLDMGVNVPLMDTRRAREELGWSPTHDAGDALLELLEGMSDKAGGPTPVLRPRARLAGPVRVKPGS